MVKRKMENKILTTGVGTTVLLTSIVLVSGTPHAYAQTHYQIGYDDGCAGRLVEGHHTSDYKRGYADGQAACSRGNSGGNSTFVPFGGKLLESYSCLITFIQGA
jgi:hypothetical protein